MLTIAALLAGVLLAASLPPLSVTPAIAAYAALVLLVDAADHARRPLMARIAIGYAFGFGYHLAGLWWIGSAFLVDVEAFAALLPLAVVGLPLGLALFHALGVALAGVPAGRLAQVLTLALALSFTEWLRGTILTGFPWNVPAAQVLGLPAFAQAASVVGVSGLGALVVLVGASPALLPRRPAAFGLIALGAVAITVLGSARLADDPSATGPQVRIVQPAIAQRDKWDADHRPRIWATLLDLTARPGADGERPPVVVWPETAVPFLYQAPSLAQADVAAALGEGRALLAGVVELTGEGPERRATNTVLLVGPDGFPRARYHKVRLVPFGEYLPLEGVLARLGLAALAEGAGGFVAGTGSPTMEVPGLGPVRPLICYEVIFPRARETVRAVVNVTNDAWFGDTPGPHQHLALARLRAIEEGVPVVRAANTGISAVIDGRGRIVAHLPLGEAGILDAPVPQPIETVYGLAGPWPLRAMWLIATVGLAAVGRTRRRAMKVAPFT